MRTPRKVRTLVAALVLTAGPVASAFAAEPPEFAYVANYVARTVSAFRINAFTGALEALPGPPAATGANPVAVVVADNRFVYVVNNGANDPGGIGTVSGFSLDGTGALSPVPGSPFDAAVNPAATDLTSATVDPGGHFLYVTDALVEKIRGFQIAPTGALSPIPGSPFPLGNNADAIAVHPSGRVLYAAAYSTGVAGGDGIATYSIDPATGALTRLAPGAPLATDGGQWPRGGLVDPSGRYFYAANATSGNVSAYALDATTALPSPVAGSPVAAGAYARQVAITPSRQFLYAAVANGNVVSGYAIASSTGALTPLATPTFAAGSIPQGLAVDASGRFIYAANSGSGNVSGYGIEATGALTPLTGSPFAAGTGAVAIAVTNHDLLFRDDFEAGGLGAWTAASTDGADLAVSTDASLEGSLGLSATVDDTTSLYVLDDHAQGESRYRARFLLDATGFDPGEVLGHHRVRILIASQETPARRIVTLVLRRRDGQFAVAGRVLLDDGTRVDTPFVGLAAGPHSIQFDWRRADVPPAQDGSFELFVDDVSVASLVGLDNDTHPVDFVRLGVMGPKAGAAGTLAFDAFSSRRYNFNWR
jgi:6-phosphogluconolactonase